MMQFFNRCANAVVNVCRKGVEKVSNGYAATGAGLTVASTGAIAQTDYSAITGAVDWSDVGGLIIAILAGVAGVMVAWKAGAWVVSAIKRA